MLANDKRHEFDIPVVACVKINEEGANVIILMSFGENLFNVKHRNKLARI